MAGIRTKKTIKTIARRPEYTGDFSSPYRLAGRPYWLGPPNRLGYVGPGVVAFDNVPTESSEGTIRRAKPAKTPSIRLASFTRRVEGFNGLTKALHGHPRQFLAQGQA